MLGLGRFGSSVLKELARLGYDVVGADKNEKVLQDEELQDAAAYLVEVDVTSTMFLEELNVANYDAVVISMGDDFESAILTVLALKDLGCETIYAKANDKKRGRGLKGAGATDVFYPEEETGRRVAYHIANPDILQYIRLSPYCSGVEMAVPEEFIGNTLAQLDFRRKYNALVVMITSDSEKVPLVSPPSDYVFKAGDTIFMVGEKKDLERLRKKF
ncbi:potassium transporter Trk [Weizmannia acidilactici]|uniref:Potassium transporter Trk n=1 Tax=Weizmannia acidilactici TaxID=2607726 RepID=A0A5J4JPH8_9BACI|nr:TrkA family potassium uptake protein [Weizmannia acidilactici]GER68091.1 potassium transporter Trk [Weizmannia acidilactici]GER70934.1 potassium transporter Trk [Weizmannia acidilactici]GER73951.1 potassium transporter Trk [Weizmannia acidilactici]